MKTPVLVICFSLFMGTFSLFAQGIHNFDNIEYKLQKQINEALARYEKFGNSNPESESFSYRSNGYETVVSSNSTTESEVHAAINPADSNNIVVSPIMQSSIGLSCPIYYTKDMGLTWKMSNFNAKLNGVLISGGGDPNIAFDKDGRCYISWINLYLNLPARDSFFWGMFWAYSDDGGENWTVPKNNIIGLDGNKYGGSGINLKYMFDKQWMATDQSNGPFSKNLYCTLFLIGTNPAQRSIICKTKPADSIAFNDSFVTVSDSSFKFVQFASIDVDQKGDVHIAFYGTKDSSTYALWHSVSSDGGQSFSVPNKIADMRKPDYIRGILTSRLYPCPYLVADKSSGIYTNNLYITWTSDGTTENNKNGSDIYFSKSSDGGQTWSMPVIVNTDDKSEYRDQFYSSITVNPEGVVILSWWDGRNLGDNRSTWYFMTYSFDGGETFIPEFYVSADSTNFLTVGKQRTFGIGEYNQVVASNGNAYPVWADGRKGNGDLDIYMAQVAIRPSATGIKSISRINSEQQFELYPNPAHNFINVLALQNMNEPVSYTISDITGKQIYFSQTGDFDEHKNLKIDISTLNSGSYLLKITGDKQIQIKTFVKL